MTAAHGKIVERGCLLRGGGERVHVPQDQVLSSFSKGFDTVDLRNAREMLGAF